MAHCQRMPRPCLVGLEAPELPDFSSPLPLQVFVVELLGRRVLLLLGFFICFTACCVLTAALALQVSGEGPRVDHV